MLARFLKKIKDLWLKKEAREVFWSFVTKAITFMLFFGIEIILAHNLLKDDYGRWTYFFSVFSILFVFSNLGLNTSAQKYLAENSGKLKEQKLILKQALLLRIIISLLFGAVVFVISDYLAECLHRPFLSQLLRWSIPFLIMASYVEFAKKVVTGMHNQKWHLFINFFEYFLRLFLLLVVFGFFTYSVSLPLIGFTLGEILAFFVVFVFLYIALFKKNVSELESKNCYYGQLLRYSLPFIVASIGYVVLTEIDIIMLGKLSGLDQVAHYGVAKKIIVKSQHISFAIAMGTMPAFAKKNNNSSKVLRKKFKNVVKLNAFVMSAVFFVLLILGWFMIPFLFGAKFKSSVAPFYFLLPYLLSTSCNIIFGQMLDYRGKGWIRAGSLVLTIILNIILNLILIPVYGASGAAIATTVSYIPSLLVNGIAAYKELQ